MKREDCEAVPRRTRIQGASTCVSLNSRLESKQEEEDWHTPLLSVRPRKPTKRTSASGRSRPACGGLIFRPIDFCITQL